MRPERRRGGEYRRHWDHLIGLYGRLCFYCHDEVATQIDHVVPWTYDQDNSQENLVPACALCNSIAGSRHFEDVEQKRQYVLNRRKRKVLRRAICSDCFLPFAYREHSPSLLLCAECYDLEYETVLSHREAWRRWLSTLRLSGTIPEAHAMLRNALVHFRASDKAGKVDYLVDAYDECRRAIH